MELQDHIITISHSTLASGAEIVYDQNKVDVTISAGYRRLSLWAGRHMPWKGCVVITRN